MDSNLKRQITSFFRSRKLAIALIVLIIFFSILGTHIPQKSQLKPVLFEAWEKNNPVQAKIFDYIGFTHLFSSFIFISISALLFINTLFCTKSMVSSSLKRFASTPQFQNKGFIENLEFHKILSIDKDQSGAGSAIRSSLQAGGYKIFNRDNTFFAEKNRIGVFGTSIFHLCIIITILAVVYGSSERMEGDMRLIEGQTLSEDHGNYMFINEGPFFQERHRKFNITLEKFYSDYTDETGTSRGPSGKLVITENGQTMKSDVVFTNHQMNYKGYTFLGNVYGLAPLLLLINPDGTVYSGSYITATDDDNSQRYVSYFHLGDTGLEAGMMVYMTAILSSNLSEEGAKQTPILFIKIFKDGKEINNATMRLNQTIKAGDKTLGFYDIKYWSNFYVVKDNSMPYILAGFGLMTLSLFISFFIVPKRIWIELVETGDGEKEIHIGGKSDKFKSLYGDEFFKIVNEISSKF